MPLMVVWICSVALVAEETIKWFLLSGLSLSSRLNERLYIHYCISCIAPFVYLL